MADLRAKLTGKRSGISAEDKGLRAKVPGKRGAPDPKAAEEPKKGALSTQTGGGIPNRSSEQDAKPPEEQRSVAGFQQQNDSSDSRTKYEKVGVDADARKRLANQEEVSWDGKKAPSAPKNYDKEYAERVQKAGTAHENEEMSAENYQKKYKEEQEQLAEQQRKDAMAQQQKSNSDDQFHKQAAIAHQERGYMADRQRLLDQLRWDMNQADKDTIYNQIAALDAQIAGLRG
jgi:hypothetical protein